MPSTISLELFAPVFENLTDPRINRTKRHSLRDIMVIAVCATVAGANSWVNVERYGKAKLEFFQSFLELPNGIPSHDTFGRVFGMLDPAGLTSGVVAWLNHLQTAVNHELVHVDGKTLRGSFDSAAGKNPLHLISAWASEAGLFLGQVAVDAKSNEITAIPLLLKLLDLRGKIVTIDAMGCQKTIAAAICDKEADYVLPVKDNQPSLHQAVSAAFIDHADRDFSDRKLRRYKTVDENHGRHETREYFIVPAPEELRTGAWRDLQSIGMVVRTCVEGDNVREEIAYYITSLKARVKQFARAVRGHWSIENQLHWSLDVTFAEDGSRVRKDNGPENFGVLRRLALSLLKQDTTCNASLQGKRLMAGWNDDILIELLCGFSGV